MNRKRRTAGFTLLELMIGSTLLLLVLGGMAVAIDRGMGMFEQSFANQEVDSRLDRALARITEEFLGVNLGSVGPDFTTPAGDPTTWSDFVEFQQATDYVNDALVLGSTTRIELRRETGEPNDGVDNDGDGLIDEGVVVLIRDLGLGTQDEVVLANNVTEYLEGETPNVDDDNGNGLEDERGLAFDQDGGTLNVRLTVAGRGPQGLIVRSRTASIALRN